MGNKLKWWAIRSGYALAFCFFVIVAFSVSSIDLFCSTKKAREVSAQNDLRLLTSAIAHFRVDYGYYPQITESGSCEAEEANAAFVRILTGNDQRGNPRQIRYLEIPEKRAIPPAVVRSGVNKDTGAWVDPWGNFYRIRIATDDRRVPNPYSDDGPRYLETVCIAWSIGEDGIQGQKNQPLTKKRSDDITSWETR